MAATLVAMNKTQNIKPRMGIDIGRVIMAPVKGGKADTSFLTGNMERAMQTPPSPGAFDGVRALVDASHGQAWLISKAGANVQHKTKQWLREWDFFNETGMPRGNLRFCLRRHEKAHHCSQLKITHFIDDRLDVLEHLRGIVPNLYLFGEQKRPEDTPCWVTHVADWPFTTSVVLNDLADGD
ncbi:MAG: hypothetical protein OER56_09535 [Hyphomicrobiales bacterium]|nr:hypothetical protein [Hyphomicrobiales bacterium]